MKRLLWVVVFLLYLLTAARTLTGFGDSDELIASGYTLSIPHPPGYPLLVLLINLFTHIPSLAPGFGANILAAGIMATVVLLLYEVGLTLLHQKSNPWLWLTAFGVATTGLIWEHGTYIEVFGLNALFSLLLLLFSIRLVDAEKKTNHFPHFLVLWAATAGLGMAHHQTFIFVLLPLSVFLMTFYIKQRPVAWKLVIRIILLTIVFFSLGYGLLLPISLKNSPYSWQFSPTLEGLWHFYTRGDYSGYSPETGMMSAWWSGIQVDKTIETLQFFVLEMWRHWGLFMMVGVIGIATSRKRLGMWYMPLLVVWILAGPVFAGYITLSDSAWGSVDFETARAILERMYLLHEVWWGLWTLIGAAYSVEKILSYSRRLSKVDVYSILVGTASVLLIGVTFIRFGGYDLSGYKTMEQYMMDILEPLPHGSRLICLSDATCFGAAYVQTLLNVRPDITVISSAPQYRYTTLKNTNHSRFWYPDNPFRIGEMVGWLTLKNQPVYITQLNEYWTKELGLNTESFWLVPAGYMTGISIVPPVYQTPLTYPNTQAWPDRLTDRHRFIAVLKAIISEQHGINAHLLSRMDRYDEAKDELNRGLVLTPENRVLTTLDKTLSKNPPDPRYQVAVDEESYLTAAKKCRQAGNMACDLRFSQWAVWRRPNHVASRLNLAYAMEIAKLLPLSKREYAHVLDLEPGNMLAAEGLNRLEKVEDLGEKLY